MGRGVYICILSKGGIYIYLLPLKESTMNLGLKLVSNNCGGFVLFFAGFGVLGFCLFLNGFVSLQGFFLGI